MDPHEVNIAGQKKIQHWWHRQVCESATETEARALTGRNPAGLKWTDANKGSPKAPRHRSRLVCTEVRHKGAEQTFSATPPLEALRVLLCVACQEDIVRVENERVCRAHFHADAVRDENVRLPDEDPKVKGARQQEAAIFRVENPRLRPDDRSGPRVATVLGFEDGGGSSGNTSGP